MESNIYLSDQLPGSQGTQIRDLFYLNSQFLSLLAGSSARGDMPPLLGRELIVEIGALSDSQAQRIANCPYSLFDIGFGDAQYWQALSASANEHIDPVSAERRPVECSFALAALLYARQLCEQYPDLARLFLGMTPTVAQCFGDVSLPCLTRAAFDDQSLLVARLGDHPHFWPDLLDFVRDGTQEHYLAAQTLGVQHATALI